MMIFNPQKHLTDRAFVLKSVKQTSLLILLLLQMACKPEVTIDNSSLLEEKNELISEIDQLQNKKDSLEMDIIELDSLTYRNEKFHPFLMQFINDSTFSSDRIKWPLKFITEGDIENIGSSKDTQYLDDTSWQSYYSLLSGQDATNTDIYDNFELESRPTNQRVLHKYAIEQCGDIKYYFKGFDEKWKLIKIVHLGP